MYNITNTVRCQYHLTNEEFNTITNKDINFVLNRIEERIFLRDTMLPYIKKAILFQDNGKSPEENKILFDRLACCGHDIWIDKVTNRIGTANFCKNRLCPVCNFRKSNKQWGKIFKTVEEHDNLYQYILITLTVENCKGEFLSKTIDDILNSFHRFTNRKKWKRSIKGYVRGLEITYNPNLNSFHPHIHILCAVEKDYFYNPEKYIDAEELTEFWKKSASLNYRPSTDIRKVDDNKKAVAEVAKYSLKMADILQTGVINSKRAEAVRILYNAIRSRRLSSLSGCFKSKFCPTSLDDIDLTDFENKRNVLNLIKAENSWQYREWLHSLDYFHYNKSASKFDKQEKVKNDKGVYKLNESIRN